MSFLNFEWIVTMILTVSFYWILPFKFRKVFLIVSTFTFLAIFSLSSAIILSGFAIIIHLLVNQEKLTGQKTLLSILIVFLLLAYFKVRFFNAGGTAGDIIENIAIPLGLSYYTFRIVHFILERYRETLPPQSFLNFLAYLFFLPTIVVGPINRFGEINAPDAGQWSQEKIWLGLERLLFGYFKIVVIGNFLIYSQLDNYIGSLDYSSKALIYYLQIVQGGLGLYFLFSGYADIAIGFAKLLGYNIDENFNWPYIQKNISDFWRCWHISLSSWCRDYVYFPVAGMTRNPYIATLATFIVIGLWHEISFRYITWGLYHGCGILIWRSFQNFKRNRNIVISKEGAKAKILDFFSILLTLHFVLFGLVIVNQKDFGSVMNVYYTVLLSWAF